MGFFRSFYIVLPTILVLKILAEYRLRKEFPSNWSKLTILTWKNLHFTEKIHRNTGSAASDVLHMFTQTISSFNPLSYRCLKNVIYQIDSKNEWLLLSVTFTAKLELVFVLIFESAFSDSFHFIANRSSIGSSKKRF